MLNLRQAVIGLAGAATVVAPAAAVAQGSPPSASSSSPTAPSPRAMALAHRYMEVTHVEELNRKMMASMFSGMRGNFAKASGLSDAKADQSMNSFQAVLTPMVEKLVSRMEPIVAETFTEQELQAMVDFYGSPVGQSVLQKIPVLTGKMSAISMDLMNGAMATTPSVCTGAGCPPKP
jgi:uncharacterized protein